MLHIDLEKELLKITCQLSEQELQKLIDYARDLKSVVEKIQPLEKTGNKRKLKWKEPCEHSWMPYFNYCMLCGENRD